MAFVVDTNLLVYAAARGAPEHEVALALLERWRKGTEAWFTTWGILYEFFRVATHRRVLPRPLRAAEAVAFASRLLSSRGFHLLVETERHADVLRDLITTHPRSSGNLMHDIHTAALMREHGILEIRTADTDFHQFGFLRVVNPLIT